MTKTIARYLVLNLGLLGLLMLVFLSIAGAFMGASRAAVFFNSPPLAVFWIALTGLFCAAFVFWKSLYIRLNLLLCHLGFIAVLLGGLWGSQAAHTLRTAAGMTPKLTKGVILLHQGQTGSRVTLSDRPGEFDLPFDVHLAETGVTYYDEPLIAVYDARGRFLGTIPAEVGDSYALPADPPAHICLTRRFENLRLLPHPEGGVQAVEGESEHANPGYELCIQTDDDERFLYVFERWEPHFVPGNPFVARYFAPRIPREYASRLVLKKGEHILAEKTIRVNDPLHYGGYHFYQSTFGQDHAVPYSGIMVVSDSGTGIVFFGYALVTAGLFGQFWIQPLLRRRRRREGGGDAV